MNVLVVSGIWPPDVGGPASHAPEVAAFLRARGHEVEVVVTADGAPAPERYPVRWVDRAQPPGVRHLRGIQLVRDRARRADVVYTTGMFGRSTLGSQLARRPFVVKLTSDPAYERARRWRLFAGSLAEFQTGAPLSTLPLRAARDLDVRRAAHVVCPSGYLRELAIGWGLGPDEVTVLPNPTPPLPDLAPREDLRSALGVDGPTLAFAGRLTTQKSLGVALEALARLDGVTLLLAGDGPDRAPLEALATRLGVTSRVRFLGARSRRQVLELFRAADASILTSSWENFPHTVVEALAVGAPVVATRTGGVAEVVTDGVNGLLVDPGDPDAFAAAVRRLYAEEGLRDRLAAAAAPSVDGYGPERIYGRLEEILLRAAR